jgi:hypothetical protein
VIVGYGPTGRTVLRLLRENGVEPTMLELNVDTVRELKQEGIDAVYGDATRPESLEAAGVATAGSLILTSAGMPNSADVIRTARELNPRIRVLARAAYLRDLPTLRNAGADTVYTGGKWRWPSSRTCSSASGRRRSRSTASARGRTRSCSGRRRYAPELPRRRSGGFAAFHVPPQDWQRHIVPTVMVLASVPTALEPHEGHAVGRAGVSRLSPNWRSANDVI